LLAHRLPDPPPLIGAEIEAVTVEYIQICRTLHLSMRREFAQARTLPRFASPLLSRHDNLLQQQLQTRRPVEIVFERRNVVRVFGATDVLNIIQAHVPGIEIRTMHLGHSEAIHACAWSRFDDLPLPRSLPEE
jgi:hypothetical protein